jgi:hypothetical protein
MTDLTPLSPAAQAVMNAGTNGNPNIIDDPVYRQCIAAALRAAADRAIRKPEHYEELGHSDYDDGWNEALGYITSIAAELEGKANRND